MKTDERLTEHSPDQTPISKKSICSASPMFCHDYSCNECPIGEMINRLCEYEDTGLTAEEIVREIRTATPTVETNIFDKETIIENCTVQILENTVTGEVSIGWWRNE